jgi:AraC-like DNA-binding protein
MPALDPIRARTNERMPLESWSMGVATSPDAAEELTTRAFRPHHLEPHGHNLRLRINRAPLGCSDLLAVAYDADVDLDVGCNEDFFVEHFVARGEAELTQNHNSSLCSGAAGAVVSATKMLSLRLSDDCILIGIRIERDRLESHFRLLTGRECRNPIVFEDRVDLARGPGARRHQLVRFAMGEVERSSPIRQPSFDSDVEDAYLTALLTGQPHSLTHLVKARPPDAGVAAVSRVEDYIRAHPEQPLRSETLVALSGVSASALYEAFQRLRGTSPMRLLREVRLERVRQDLHCAEPWENVTHIALRWGFTHLARFSALYRTRFGELPSHTLAQLRRAS